MDEIGKPLYWDLDAHVKAVIQMVQSDEIQIALTMLEQVPSWYRENYPPILEEIKKTLFQQCYDPFDYASDFDEANFSREEVTAQCMSPYTFPRADILYEHIKELNKTCVPWIFEISPSHGWLPVGFSDRGLKFSFFGKNLNQPALKKVKDWLPDGVWQERPKEGQLKVLVNFESLEHMWFPHDLERSAKKIAVDFDFIYLSTPKHTLGGGLKDWNARRLGHIRCYSPKEFLEFASRSFPGYIWSYYDSHSMVIRGQKT